MFPFFYCNSVHVLLCFRIWDPDINHNININHLCISLSDEYLYFPGMYLFEIKVLRTYDILKKEKPGLSVRAFVDMLDTMSATNNCVCRVLLLLCNPLSI